MPTVERIPSQGETSNLIERLLSYVSPVKPNWAASVEGVSNDELTRYCELAGLSVGPSALPETYLAWARFAGRADGGLIEQTLRAWVSIPELIQFYEDWRRFQPEFIEPQFPVVINLKIGDEISFDLREHTGEPQLRETGSGEDMGFFAESWEKLLFQCACESCEPNRFPSIAIYGASANSTRAALGQGSFGHYARNITQYMANLGLVPAWFNDARHVFGFATDLTAIVDIGMGGEAPLKVIGETPSRVQEIGGALAARIGAKPASHEKWR